MVSKEMELEIRILARQGMSIRRIAHELSVSRNTVRKYLRGEAVRTPESRSPGRPRLLLPYEDWLRRRLAAAAPVVLPATVLHREIAAMGYKGSERSVRRFCASHRPSVPEDPLVRFETAPGHQAQMDWGEYRLGRERIYAFVGVLGFSRWLYLEYVESMRSEVLVACHRRMFEAFGGIPHEILYDNMKTAVVRRNAYGIGRHRFHDDLWDLAKECGFRPRLCQPYRPRTKGKVERAVQYAASSFYYPMVTRVALEGRTPEVEEINAEARLWQYGVANVRVHATTGERPIDRLEAERAAMTPYMGVVPSAASDRRERTYPRFPIQRSPREYDAILQEMV
ncbi:MAG: IS21 family transposase [Burkholderiaceae bacterium]|nr:IS21 family transposase [Burkholderiaceae bacterium]MCP5265585.1 IS21 family transposase [Burkholderiaceae bacterium]